MWTRKKTHTPEYAPDLEEWGVLYNGTPCGTLWRDGHGPWFWCSWTHPKEAGRADTMEDALAATRAAVLRTDGTMSALHFLVGPDFPEGKRRSVRR